MYRLQLGLVYSHLGIEFSRAQAGGTLDGKDMHVEPFAGSFEQLKLHVSSREDFTAISVYV